VAVLAESEAGETALRATRRIRAELSASGFELVEVDASTLSPRGLRSVCERASADGGVLITRGEGERIRAWVWLARHDPGVPEISEIKDSGGDAEFLAVRAIEFVEASLLELPEPEAKPVAPEPSAGESEGAEASEETRAPGARFGPMRSSLGFGGGVLVPVSAGTPTAALSLQGRAHFGRARRLHAGLAVRTSLVPSAFAFDGGETSVSLIDARGLFGLSWRGREGVSPMLEAGLGPAFAFARESILDGQDWTTTALVSAGGGIGFSVSSSLRIDLQARLGVLLPAMQVLEPEGVAVSVPLAADLGVAVHWTLRD
jgi:hypothetical protein